MGLGKGISVDVDRYFDVLSRIYDHSKVLELFSALKTYGLDENATVYSGEKTKDGQVLITYSLKDSNGNGILSGVLRFGADGKVYENLKGKSVAFETDEKLAKMFIYGLFGSDEVLYGVDGAAQVALDSARGCWIADAGQCNLKFEEESEKISTDSTEQKPDYKPTYVPEENKKKEDHGCGFGESWNGTMCHEIGGSMGVGGSWGRDR